MITKHTITLTKGPDCWLAKFSDPQIKELFGTDTIPTAFLPSAHPDNVFNEIWKLNPECKVIIKT